jgi:hypothetical protein
VPHRVDCLYIAPHNLSLGRPTRQSSTYAQKFSYLVGDPGKRLCVCRRLCWAISAACCPSLRLPVLEYGPAPLLLMLLGGQWRRVGHG